MSDPKRDQREFHYLSAAIGFLLCVMISIAILHLDEKTASKPTVDLVKTIIWPSFFVCLILFFQEHFTSLLTILLEKISAATEISAGGVVFRTETSKIPSPGPEERVTLANVSLLHTSFISSEMTKKISDGMNYYQIEVIVVAKSSTLDRIESVTYTLDPSYPKQPTPITDRASRFKLKELANGTSIIQAAIKFRDQDQPLQLNRFIDLRPDGPRI